MTRHDRVFVLTALRCHQYRLDYRINALSLIPFLATIVLVDVPAYPECRYLMKLGCKGARSCEDVEVMFSQRANVATRRTAEPPCSVELPE